MVTRARAVQGRKKARSQPPCRAGTRASFGPQTVGLPSRPICRAGSLRLCLRHRRRHPPAGQAPAGTAGRGCERQPSSPSSTGHRRWKAGRAPYPLRPCRRKRKGSGKAGSASLPGADRRHACSFMLSATAGRGKSEDAGRPDGWHEARSRASGVLKGRGMSPPSGQAGSRLEAGIVQEPAAATGRQGWRLSGSETASEPSPSRSICQRFLCPFQSKIFYVYFFSYSFLSLIQFK